MRRLFRRPTPAILVTHAQTWTSEYLAALADGRALPSRWRHDEVVAELRAETFEKCAYCEVVIADASYPHVEHMIPKSKRPELALDWTNLTLGCPVCNTHKGDYYEPSAPILHPYNDDPQEHLVFRGPAVLGALASELGGRTVDKLQLMRPALVLERMKRIEALHRLLERWAISAGPDKDIMADVIRTALADDQEFAQSLRAYAVSVSFPIDVP